MDRSREKRCVRTMKNDEAKLRQEVLRFLLSAERSKLPEFDPRDPDIDLRCRAGWPRTVGGNPVRFWETGRGEKDFGLKTPNQRRRKFTQDDNLEFIVISRGWPLHTVQKFVAKWNASEEKGKFFLSLPWPTL